MFYVKAGSAVKRPEDLQGKRIGIPEWAQTAGIYGRGYLSDYLGLDLASMQWVQAGVNQPGRVEKVRLTLPAGIHYTNAPDKSLNQMLLDGSVDALMTARPPAGLGQGIERLMPDYQALELAYFKATRVYPIMHALVIKTAVLDAHPWVAMNVYKAFMKAKTQSMARLSDITASHAPMPWLADYTARLEAVFGADFYPYGIGQDAGGQINRATLESFCKFGHDQGVCDRLLNVEELFAKNVLGSFKV